MTHILTTVSVVFFAAYTFAVQAELPQLDLSSGHQSLLRENALSHAFLWGTESGSSETSVVTVDGMPFVQALRVDIPQPFPFRRAVQLGFKTVEPVSVGDVLFLEIWMRTVNMNQDGEVRFVLEESRSPWEKMIWVRQQVERKWTRYRIPVTCLVSAEKEGLQLCIQLGGKRQTVELGGLRLLNFHNTAAVEELPYELFPYEGIAGDSPWRADAEVRIQKYRKADLTVKVIDEKGTPVQGSTVHIQMLRHAFPFGSVYKTKWFHGEAAGSADAETYRETFKKLFNMGVDEYTMKWPWWEKPAEREGVNAALNWMAMNRIAVRGHCLVWGSFRMMPGDIPSLTSHTQQLKQRILDHIDSEVSACRGKVVAWDVVNEPQTNNDIFKRLGYSFMADCFRAARNADSTVRLVLNETEDSSMGEGQDLFEEQAKMLLNKGAPIDALGFQSHFSQAGVSIPEIDRILSRFEKTGLDLEITEFDFLCSDRQMQADFTRDFMTLCFSHPGVVSFLTWSFWAGSCLEPDRAMFSRDWSIRPNGQVYKDLVFKKWWTDETLITDHNGEVSIRGFLGDYQITVTQDERELSQTLTLPRSNSELKIILH